MLFLSWKNHLQTFGYLAGKPSYTCNCKDEQRGVYWKYEFHDSWVVCLSVEMVGGSFYHRVNIERWTVATLWNIGPSTRDSGCIRMLLNFFWGEKKIYRSFLDNSESREYFLSIYTLGMLLDILFLYHFFHFF